MEPPTIDLEPARGQGMKRVLMTGAAGDIGGRLRKLLKPVYPELRLSDIREPADLQSHEPFVAADLARLEEVEKAVDGMDGIIHLGGHSVEGPWETILQSNIIGCRNLFEAAHRKGVKRVVFASSNHAVGFYPRYHRIGVDAPVRPDSRYGVSKAFGEAIGALYADKHGLRVLCLRIGNVGDKPIDRRRLAIWIKPEDLAQLIRIGLEHADLRYEIFYGASFNERSWWDNSRAYAYGYRPAGRAEDFREEALAAQAKLATDPVGDFYQGGTFCSAEFTADAGKVWS
jgi:uronate dehydrogenase